MIYLASPYSHPDPGVRFYRYVQARRFVGQRFQVGEHVFSSIVYCHPIAEQIALPTDHLYWLEFNKNFLLAAQSVYLLKIDGWEDSLGVTQELDFARRHGLPVKEWEPITE